jgi:hypothetical protein
VLCMISMHYFCHSFPFPSTIRSLDFPHPLAKVQPGKTSKNRRTEPYSDRLLAGSPGKNASLLR